MITDERYLLSRQVDGPEIGFDAAFYQEWGFGPEEGAGGVAVGVGKAKSHQNHN